MGRIKDTRPETLFGCEIDDFTIWKKEWKDMPEFVQEDLEPWKSIEVYFDDYFEKNGKLIHNRLIRIHFEDYKGMKDFGRLFCIAGLNHQTKIFKYNKSVEEFCKLLNQEVTDKTKFLWHPLAEIGWAADKLYIDG